MEGYSPSPPTARAERMKLEVRVELPVGTNLLGWRWWGGGRRRQRFYHFPVIVLNEFHCDDDFTRRQRRSLIARRFHCMFFICPLSSRIRGQTQVTWCRRVQLGLCQQCIIRTALTFDRWRAVTSQKHLSAFTSELDRTTCRKPAVRIPKVGTERKARRVPGLFLSSLVAPVLNSPPCFLLLFSAAA